MISWNQWLRLFSQPILHVFNHKKLYTNKKKRPSLEGLEERITPVNPSVTSILRNAGTAASTSASYAVSFSESVTGVDSADFTTSTSGGVASTSISVAGSGATYTVTILGITGTGSISLNLVDNDTIRNSTSQPLGGTNLSGISFSAKTDYSTGASSGPHAITTGQINADGFTDIITANRFNNKLRVFLGVGDGTFNPQTPLNTGTEPQGITTGDINNDGNLDLVTANSFDGIGGNTVSVLVGNGDGKFLTKPVVAILSAPLSVILGDFNSDGKLDIATANEGSHSVSILLGNGNGTFIAATNPETGSGTKSVAMGDVNGDGFLDLATADFFGGLSLLLANGDGSFKPRIPLTAGSNPFSVIIADVNGDGKKDLISANYGSNNVSILLGNGNGTFQSATPASTGTKPVSVAAADLDGDGKIDLAVANSYNNFFSPINTISLLAGNGDGTFKAAINFTTGTRPYSVTIADFNGDSKPDIATANEGSNNISVFLNTTNNPSNFAGQTYTVTAPATQISITTTAAGAPSGLAFTTQPVITIKDAAGNTVTSSNVAVIMTVSTGATIIGSATINAINGIATFTDVGISGTSGTAYTLTFASSGLTSANQSITLADTTAPTITIASDKTALRIGETATLTFTLSEVSTNFSDADITVVGGTVGTLSGSGSSYTAVFTPTANSATPANINVTAATFTDAAGNNNTAATQLSINIDTTAPTITITSDKTALRIGETATLTFTLSEAASTALISSNITVTGGALSNFAGSGLIYTATFTPTNNSTTPATINVLANTFTDAAGNNNTAATQFTIQVDTTAPTITITSDKTALRIGETATLTFTLSEAASTALSSSSITVVGGALSNFAGSGLTYTAVFTPTATSTATATFNVAAATFTDPAGNNNTAALQFSINIDTTAPTITITSDKTALRIGETATLTFALSEVASTALISSNITVVGGALSNFVGSGLTYTATFTPTNNRTTPASINVLANTFTDGAGNNNTAAPQLSINIDTAAPTITIASDKTALKSGETATLTFTLSEAASTALISSSITVDGGTVSNFFGSGLTYTATFTPSASTTTTATINIAASTFTDAAGNPNTAATQLSINIDTVAPTVTITSLASALKIGETATLTFTLSEAASDFAVSDIITTDGALSNFAGSGTSYTATFTPNTNSTATATINVAASTFTDSAGNLNTASNTISITVDTTAPTITITSSASALKSGETATITFTLSEASSDFIASDIITTGGVLSNFSGSGLTYTATFTPTNNSTTPATINVAASTFTDSAGNNNTAATQFTIQIDTIAPTITIASNKTALKIGETATLTFTLSEVSTNFSDADITVVGGTLGTLSGSSSSYTATFTPNTNSTATATINFAASTFTDGAGNLNTASNTISITVDTTAPTITITSSASALKISETATITFTLSEVSTNFSDADITVVGGTLGTLSGSGSSYTAVFTPTASSTTLATFNVAAATFTDAAGNDNTAATQLTILVDTVAPTIIVTSNKTALRIGETATLTFTLSEVSTNFSDADITVVNGTLGTLSGSGSSYTAVFTPTASSTTLATFNVAAATFTDAAGNDNTAATQFTILVDTTAPTITIASDKTALRIGETATITFTISEVASTALISSSITVEGGTLSNFVGSSLTYTATFTPTNNRTTPASINVLANTFTDGAGNPNTVATQFTIQVDTTALSPAPSPAASPAPAPAPTPTPSPTPTRIMTASSSSSIAGVSSTVNLIDQNIGKQISSVIPFPGFSGELRIAMADMNQDGKTEMIIAAGPGGGPAIMVMDSETGTVLQTFFAFDPAFNGGIFVTIADFNSDGIMDIVVGAGSGGGPHIKIFDGSTLNVLRSFFAYQENFNGGVSVAATDINGDGFAELVTGAGPGGSSHVKVFNGKTFEIISQWYAYSSDFKGGIFVAVGDIGNDGKFEVVTGAGEGGGSVVAIWDPYTGALLNQFLAYDENFGGGARVGISDGNGDGIADILTGAGPGGGPQVNGYSFPALDLLFSFYSGNPNNGGGVFV
jgi:hypothetical protein